MSGIGGYVLIEFQDRAFAFYYDHSGKLDYMVMHRSGTGGIGMVPHAGGVKKPAT